MKVIDPGHKFELTILDGLGPHLLTFVKREGPGYPGNVGHYPGTNLQEVLRALIERVKYLDHQVPCSENKQLLLFFRESIFLLERRAAKRHNRWFDLIPEKERIEKLPACPTCGHLEHICGSKPTVDVLTGHQSVGGSEV